MSHISVMWPGGFQSDRLCEGATFGRAVLVSHVLSVLGSDSWNQNMAIMNMMIPSSAQRVRTSRSVWLSVSGCVLCFHRSTDSRPGPGLMVAITRLMTCRNVFISSVKLNEIWSGGVMWTRRRRRRTPPTPTPPALLNVWKPRLAWHHQSHTHTLCVGL